MTIATVFKTLPLRAAPGELYSLNTGVSRWLSSQSGAGILPGCPEGVPPSAPESPRDEAKVSRLADKLTNAWSTVEERRFSAA